MPTATNKQVISAMYSAVFNRAPDAAGLGFWETQFAANANSVAALAAGFTQHPVFTETYGAMDNLTFVQAIYQNVLGGPGDAGGVVYWNNQLTNGLSRSDMLASFVSGALTIDLVALKAAGQLTDAEFTAAVARQDQLTNKANVGLQFAALLGDKSNLDPATDTTTVAGLAADPAYLASQAAIRSVTNDDATALAAITFLNTAAADADPIAFVNANAAAAAGAAGSTFVLTAGIDNFTGTSGNDTFIGDNTGTATVTAGDQLNGGAGTDTFNYFVATAGVAVVAPQLNAVENVNLIGTTTAGVTANFTNAVGLQQVTLKDTTTAASIITVGADVAAGLDNVKTAGAETFTFTATQTAATVNVVNGTNVGTTLNLHGAAITTLNVVSATGAANTIGALASTGVETTLNVSGAGNITIGAVGASLTTINAATATGTTSIDASATTGNVAYTGGTGDDTIKLGSSLTTGDVVDGGTGVNTLGVIAGATLVTGLQVSNIQTLDIGGANNVTGEVAAAANNYDLSKLAGITTLKVGSAINTENTPIANDVVTINNLAKDAAVEIGAALGTATGDALVINVKDAGAGSPNDVIGVKLAAAADFITAGDLTIADIETINLSSTTTGVNQVAHTLSNLTAAQATTVNVDASTNGLTITDLNALALVRFDASASVKAVSLTTGADAFTATGGTAFILGQGNDTLDLTGASSASAGTDFVITGGKGGDAITLSVAGQVEVLKYVAGDSFSGVTGTAKNFDAVSTFTSTEDKIDLVSFGFTGTVVGVATGAAASINAATGDVLAANAANFFGAGANQRGVVIVDDTTNTWVYVDANNDGSYQAGTDLAIQMVGLTGVTVPVVGDFVFA